jgi:hypothetical protein
MQDSVLEETGFGIYAITGSNYDLGETTVVIDIAKETIIDGHRNVKVPWDSLLMHMPQRYWLSRSREWVP